MVVVYFIVDCELMYLLFVDELVCIGLVLVIQLYLQILVIIVVVEVIGVIVIYFGYGFFVENVDFVEQIECFGFIFVGLIVEVICLMGDKVLVKDVMKCVGVFIVLGFDGLLLEDEEIVLVIVCEVGYLVIIKVVGGGGGCGMCVVYDEFELIKLVKLICIEVGVVFGNLMVYLEKFLINLCYVEVQVFFDGQGNVIYFGDCDCFLQCCYQKVIEEVLVFGIDEKVCQEVFVCCVQVCIEIGYCGVGIFEFFYENGCFYFIEMNICVQVEYLVFEMVIGVDIVKEMLCIVFGEKFLICQEDVVICGYVLECWINVEDLKIFMFSLGKVKYFYVFGGNGVCVDLYFYSGYSVLLNYDLLVGKVIIYGVDCDEVLVWMCNVLDELIVDGIKINIELYKDLVCDVVFCKGGVNIYYLEKKLGMDKY